MTKTLYLHIGRNKTGTSSLQYALANGREYLARHGFIYPLPLLDHAHLVYSLSKPLRDLLPPAEQTMMLELAAQLKNDLPKMEDDIIISSEGLMNIDPQLLKDWLGDCRTVVIVYLREQIEYLASSYQQEVKELNETVDFRNYVAKFHPLNLTYNGFIKRWADVFGEENLIVRVYDKKALVGSDVVTDFLSILKINDPAPFLSKLERDANPSINGALLEAKRIINGMGLDPRSLFEATYQPLLDLAVTNGKYRGLIGIDPNFVDEIRESVSDYNRKIAQQYFGRDELFPFNACPVESKPSAQEIKQAFRELILLVRQRNPAIAEQIETQSGQTESDQKSYA